MVEVKCPMRRQISHKRPIKQEIKPRICQKFAFVVQQRLGAILSSITF